MPETPTSWQRAVGAIETDLRAWRACHPEATLSEIEAALDGRLDHARAALLGEVAADVPAQEEYCPRCGVPLVQRGHRERTLRTAGDAALSLTRSYLSCPACGAGVFPPR